MKPTVYVETTIVGTLTLRSPYDARVLSRVLSTKKWWSEKRQFFELFVSEAVRLEVAQGDASAANETLNAIAGISLLPLPQVVYDLADHLIFRKALPERAKVDAIHLAVATVNEIKFLLTWNCKHLANAMLRGKIEAACREFGYNPPVLCTPDELTEVPND